MSVHQPRPDGGQVPRRHLQGPGSRPLRNDPMSLSQVQKWVMSTLAVLTVFHFAGGLALGAAVLPEARLDARIGLNVLAAVAGVGGMLGGLAIHKHRLVSTWLLLGLVPGLVGAYFTFLWR